MKQISKELEAIKESKRGLAEIFIKMLREIEPEDIMGCLYGENSKNLTIHYYKGSRRYYISIDL